MPIYNDDGEELNPELIPKPSLCTTCAKDDDGDEDYLCLLNRADQQGSDEFMCGAYESKFS